MPVRIRRSDQILAVPDVRQQTDYTCGPSSLRSIYRYFGVSRISEAQLAREVGAHPDKGTLPERLVEHARDHGLHAALKTGMTVEDLARCAARDAPVIVAYQAWRTGARAPWRKTWDEGHYSVVIGVDRDFVYLEDPSLKGAIGKIPRKEFAERWHDEDGNGRRLVNMGIVIECDKPPLVPRAPIARQRVVPID